MRRPEPNECNFAEASMYVYVDMDIATKLEEEEEDEALLEEIESSMELGMEAVAVKLREQFPQLRFEVQCD